MEAPPVARVATGAGRWLPNLSRGVSVWNLAPDLNARELLDGGLLTPVLQGPENLPDAVEWDVTGLVPLVEARSAHPTAVDGALRDFAARLAKARELFVEGGSYASYRAAFTVPRLDADGGAHYFYCPVRDKILVMNWGASPSASGPSDDRVVHPLRFSELIDEAPAPQEDPPGSEPARRAAEAPPKPWRPFGLLAAALVAVAAAVGWWLASGDPTPPVPPLPPPVESARGGSTEAATTAAVSASASTAPEAPPTPPPLAKIHQLIFFEVDNARLVAEHLVVLEQVRAYLDRYPSVRQLLIEGHADFRGGEGGNMALSMLRAMAARAWLVERGVQPSRLRAVGCAARYPLDATSTATGLRANRRVELHVVEPALSPGPRPRAGCVEAPP